MIEAERFDDGGEGRAYHDSTNNLTKEEWFNPIRFLEQVDILASRTASGGYKVGRTEAGEWMAYTVDVAREGTYRLEVRVASQGNGGAFRVEFGGVDKTGSIAIPDTGGWDTWQTLERPNVTLRAGKQVMRIVMEHAGSAGPLGDFDYVRLSQVSARGKT
jgi:hypothetical protein